MYHTGCQGETFDDDPTTWCIAVVSEQFKTLKKYTDRLSKSQLQFPEMTGCHWGWRAWPGLAGGGREEDRQGEGNCTRCSSGRECLQRHALQWWGRELHLHAHRYGTARGCTIQWWREQWQVSSEAVGRGEVSVRSSVKGKSVWCIVAPDLPSALCMVSGPCWCPVWGLRLWAALT